MAIARKNYRYETRILSYIKEFDSRKKKKIIIIIIDRYNRLNASRHV